MLSASCAPRRARPKPSGIKSWGVDATNDADAPTVNPSKQVVPRSDANAATSQGLPTEREQAEPTLGIANTLNGTSLGREESAPSTGDVIDCRPYTLALKLVLKSGDHLAECRVSHIPVPGNMPKVKAAVDRRLAAWDRGEGRSPCTSVKPRVPEGCVPDRHIKILQEREVGGLWPRVMTPPQDFAFGGLPLSKLLRERQRHAFATEEVIALQESKAEISRIKSLCAAQLNPAFNDVDKAIDDLVRDMQLGIALTGESPGAVLGAPETAAPGIVSSGTPAPLACVRQIDGNRSQYQGATTETMKANLGAEIDSKLESYFAVETATSAHYDRLLNEQEAKRLGLEQQDNQRYSLIPTVVGGAILTVIGAAIGVVFSAWVTKKDVRLPSFRRSRATATDDTDDKRSDDGPPAADPCAGGGTPDKPKGGPGPKSSAPDASGPGGAGPADPSGPLANNEERTPPKASAPQEPWSLESKPWLTYLNPGDASANDQGTTGTFAVAITAPQSYGTHSITTLRIHSRD